VKKSDSRKKVVTEINSKKINGFYAIGSSKNYRSPP
jgi:hypothetical protein